MRRRFDAVHDRFGTAGMIIAVIALVTALGGTALAAKGALTGKQKKEVEKIAKKFAGKNGTPGAAGTNGTNGTAGKDGAPGLNGTDGKDGISVTVVPGIPAGCPAGGVKYTSVSGTHEICNGEDGETGFTATLPPGETETGGYAVVLNENAFGEGENFTAISFPIPLAAALDSAHVHFAPHASCPGTVADPQADAGHLCVYQLETPPFVGAEIKSISLLSAGSLGASKTGASISLVHETGAKKLFKGSFAVTAPTGP